MRPPAPRSVAGSTASPSPSSWQPPGSARFPRPQIAERLDDRLALLVKGTRTALPRQQTLRAAIDWSYELLTPDEQRLLRCLSVFRGGFTLDAVQALWSDGEQRERDALELLTHLVDKSLVVITSRAETRRFGLLQDDPPLCMGTTRVGRRDRGRPSLDIASGSWPGRRNKDGCCPHPTNW